MISLFRKIRQKLLEHLPTSKAGNKVTRYLVYSLGEIFLVVIGVLIALQVNNSNELNKLKAKEREQLVYVLENIKADSLKIANALSKKLNKMKVHDEIYDYIKGEITADQVGDIDIVRLLFPLQTATQKNNPNLANEVLSQGLKKQILDYYSAIDQCEADIARYNDANETVLMPFLVDKQLLNYSSLFDYEQANHDQINRKMFFTELKEPALQQVLFVAKLKLILIHSCETYGAVENENLKQAIQTYLSEQ